MHSNTDCFLWYSYKFIVEFQIFLRTESAVRAKTFYISKSLHGLRYIGTRYMCQYRKKLNVFGFTYRMDLETIICIQNFFCISTVLTVSTSGFGKYYGVSLSNMYQCWKDQVKLMILNFIRFLIRIHFLITILYSKEQASCTNNNNNTNNNYRKYRCIGMRAGTCPEDDYQYLKNK